MSARVGILVVVALVACVTASPVQSSDAVSITRTAKTLHFPWPIGQYCQGCPNHFCEADPAIVLGYCCGCRRMFDLLPVVCTGNVVCPLDIRGVCRDYNYMLNCCC